MSRDPLHRQRGRIIFGAFIIVIGLFALLDNLHLFDSRLVQPFWPLVFVALGLLKISGARHTSHQVVGGGLVVLGVGMTLQNLGLLQIRLHDLWPVALIFLGLSVITRNFGARGTREAFGSGRRAGVVDERQEHGARIDASATMSGIALKNDSQDFTGGEISAVMGSVEIDLRQAAIVREAVLQVSIIMGGVEIKVPRDWSVSVNGTPVLGGIEDKTVPPMAPGKRLVIEGSVIMGGVEITN